MKLVKKQTTDTRPTPAVTGGLLGSTIDRRTFLRRTGMAAGGAAVATTLATRMMRRAEADATAKSAGGDTVIKRSVCTHCSVGCGVIAEVQNGVWTGQEPDFDSPLNLGAHCAKGASVREHGHGDRRLKYPMKLVGGKWQRITWDQAINEVGDKLLEIREKYSPDSVYWLGSAKFSNEQAYLFRKFAALWGSQQRRPPGAHLPLDHRGRCREHLGLRRDDQLLQRHAPVQGDALHRQQRGGGTPGRDAARAARQGERRQADRGRPALHAHGGTRRSVRPAALRHGRAAGLGNTLARLPERLGRQGVHQRSACSAWTRSAPRSRNGRRRSCRT